MAEKEYIEREAAIRALQPTHAPAINEVLASVLRRVPAADVVEVVRCRDCKHLCVHSGALGVYQCAIHGDYPSGEYFCADGERKDGGQDE